MWQTMTEAQAERLVDWMKTRNKSRVTFYMLDGPKGSLLVIVTSVAADGEPTELVVDEEGMYR